METPVNTSSSTGFPHRAANWMYIKTLKKSFEVIRIERFVKHLNFKINKTKLYRQKRFCVRLVTSRVNNLTVHNQLNKLLI